MGDPTLVSSTSANTCQYHYLPSLGSLVMSFEVTPRQALSHLVTLHFVLPHKNCQFSLLYRPLGVFFLCKITLFGKLRVYIYYFRRNAINRRRSKLFFALNVQSDLLLLQS